MNPLNDAAVAHLRQLADWPDLPGDRYEVLEVAGQGGMGTVYRVHDRVLGRDVALKVLRPELGDGEWALRLAREAQVIARLEHPGIVTVHDSGMLGDGRAYYLMRLVTGHSLAQLPQGTPLAERLRLFLRICETIDFAHSRGVIHRDLKPANIMLGSFGEVLVLDWGIARMNDSEGNEPEPSSDRQPAPGTTGPGAILGTPGFMAPEQIAGTGALIDQRTDIFALGAILRHLIQGIDETEPPRPLSAIAARAVAAAPADRYPTARELADDLTRYLDGVPVRAYQETVGEQVARVYARYQVPILLVGAYLLMRLLFLALRRG